MYLLDIGKNYMTKNIFDDIVTLAAKGNVLTDTAKILNLSTRTILRSCKANGKQYKEKDLALGLKIQFTPTLLFCDEKGKIVLRLNGYRSPTKFNVDQCVLYYFLGL